MNKYSKELFREILIEVGNPPIILLSDEQVKKERRRNPYKQNDGTKILGVAFPEVVDRNLYHNPQEFMYAPKIWVNTRDGKKHKRMRNIIYHEILHCMFPISAEYWVYICADILSGDKNHLKHDLHRFKKKLIDFPSRNQIIEMMKGTSEKWKLYKDYFDKKGY